MCIATQHARGSMLCCPLLPIFTDACCAHVHCMSPASCAVRDAGYGFYRPQMTLFDPGWRGEQTKGPEDWGVADLGNDPMGIIDR